MHAACTMFCHFEFEIPHTFCIVQMNTAFFEAFVNHALRSITKMLLTAPAMWKFLKRYFCWSPLGWGVPDGTSVREQEFCWEGRKGVTRPLVCGSDGNTLPPRAPTSTQIPGCRQAAEAEARPRPDAGEAPTPHHECAPVLTFFPLV